MTKSESKRRALSEWLKSNPGKTSRDWLLEVRCKDEKQRQDLKNFFRFLDENNQGQSLYIAPAPDSYAIMDNVGYGCDFPLEPHRRISVECDFKFGLQYDLNAPDDVYQNEDDARSTDSSWRYLRWKASQENLEKTNFPAIAYKAHFGFHTGYPHWKSYYEKWQEKTKNIK